MEFYGLWRARPAVSHQTVTTTYCNGSPHKINAHSIFICQLNTNHNLHDKSALLHFQIVFFFSKNLISMQFLLLFLFLALNFGFVFSKNEYLSTECIIGKNQFYHLKPIEPQTSNERKRNHHRENKMKCVQMNTHTHTHSEKCYIRTECRLFFYTKRYANEKRVLSTVYLLAKDTA